jgi:hypothetical protein
MLSDTAMLANQDAGRKGRNIPHNAQHKSAIAAGAGHKSGCQTS